jgi:3-deoxy-D-manno-octulosonate 8-phosphate phosphatase (KDO 8-P phosphatase)
VAHSDFEPFSAHLAEGGRGFPSVEALRALKLVVFDVDGVMSDGRIVLNDEGVQTKFFDVRDGAGMSLLQCGGLMAGIITGRSAGVVDVRARELHIPPERVRQGAKVKLPVYLQMLKDLNLAPREAAFMGDDLIDLPVLEMAAIACCPADSYADVENVCHIVSKKRGGRGAIRTVIEFILKARADGSWEKAVDIYLGRA